MEKAQIREITEKHHDAGSKATADITQIAAEEGFSCFNLKQDVPEESLKGKLLRQKGYLRDLRSIRREIPDSAAVLLQHPFHHRQLTRESTLRALKNAKGCRFICMAHDVEELRGYRYSEYYAREFHTMLELADQLIVHNDSMKNWFLEKGVREDRLTCLECFDYLVPGGAEPAGQAPDPERSLTVAGNLDPAKSGYVMELQHIHGIRIHLYGPNCDEELTRREQICYHGSVPPNELPGKLRGSFGLVWDGPSAETCAGEAGNYLRYNNPHKLSLYLASGMPVIIWKQAAAADYVLKQGAGLAVASLEEAADAVKRIPEEAYRQMAARAKETGAMLRGGYYTRRALKEAMARLVE